MISTENTNMSNKVHSWANLIKENGHDLILCLVLNTLPKQTSRVLKKSIKQKNLKLKLILVCCWKHY